MSDKSTRDVFDGQEGVWPVWDNNSAADDDSMIRSMSSQFSNYQDSLNDGSNVMYSENESSDLVDIEYTPQWTNNLEEVDVRPFIQRCGPQHDLPPDASEIDFFHLFFPKSLIDRIATETNRYAVQVQRSTGSDKNWYPKSKEEVSSLIGIFILMGISQAPDYSQYWNTNNYFKNEGIMEWGSRQRFEKLLQYLHLNDNDRDLPLGNPNKDPLYKVRPIMDEVLKQCLFHYNPRKNQCIDEGMIAYRGRHEAKQYIPSKPVRWGIKVWLRCDSQSGFCHEFEFYMGKKGAVPSRGLAAGVVDRLTTKLRQKNHHVYFDSFFTSVDLIHDLLNNGIYGCGAIRINRKHIPADLKQQPLLERGSFATRQDGNLVLVRWIDKKPVTMLSTNSDPRVVGIVTRKENDGSESLISRPESISNYQKCFRGVDIFDQLCASYPVGRESKKWWRYLFFFMLNVCTVNGYISRKESVGDRKTHLQFRQKLSEQLIGGFSSRSREVHVRPANKLINGPCLPPLTQDTLGKHKLIKLPRKKSSCKWCPKHGGQRKETVHRCSLCNVHLCSLACHTAFHTIVTEQ